MSSAQDMLCEDLKFIDGIPCIPVNIDTVEDGLMVIWEEHEKDPDNELIYPTLEIALTMYELITGKVHALAGGDSYGGGKKSLKELLKDENT